MKVHYGLDASIEAFFASLGSSITREICDKEAADLCGGGPVCPVALQGMASYTVLAGQHTIVQFRETGNYLDMQLVAQIKAMHPKTVADCEFRYILGGPKSDSSGGAVKSLAMYSMSVLEGNNLIFIRDSLMNDETRHLNAINGLATFFSQSWLRGRSSQSAVVSATAQECTKMVDHLLEKLPVQFERHVRDMRDLLLPAVMSGEYPIVLAHGDLNEMNILIDKSSGELTGIVDWAEASFLPFGFALYALDNLIGQMGPDGWTFGDGAVEMRNTFWSRFHELVGDVPERAKRLIQIAWAAGLLVRYGTEYDRGFGRMVGVRGASDESLKYLDALLPGQ